MDKMSKAEARRLTGAKSDYRLSQILGVTRQAVSLWRADRIPPDRAKQIREMAGRLPDVG